MSFFEFPHTRTYDKDLGWLIKKVIELNETLKNFVALNSIKFADPIQWNISKQYEALTVVVDPGTGTAYLSSQPVPTGVPLSNTDYWSVIFDLDIAQANENITLRDDGNNVLSTFESDEGDWLLWNGTLYKVTQPIGLSQAYVPGYNIDRYTVEEFIDDLKTALENSITILGDDLTLIDGRVSTLEDRWLKNYDTVLDMIADTDIQNDDVCNCVGYYVKGDEGYGLWHISDTETSYHHVALDNGLFAYPMNGDYINVMQYGAKGDGVTDDTALIQAAIDDGSQDALNSKTIVFPGRTFMITHLDVSKNVLLEGSPNTIFEAITSAETSVIDVVGVGAVTSVNYVWGIKNIYLRMNDANTAQIGFNCNAYDDDGLLGIWHGQFENFRIQNLSGTQKGMYFFAEHPNRDNQYITFTRVNIYRKSATAVCLELEGSIGQINFVDCEFNSITSGLAGDNVIIKEHDMSSRPIMPVTFTNCTIQTSVCGINARWCVLIFIGCHFENLTYGLKVYNNIVNFDNTEFASVTKPVSIDTNGSLYGTVKWTAPGGDFVEVNNIGANGYDITNLHVLTGGPGAYNLTDPWGSISNYQLNMYKSYVHNSTGAREDVQRLRSIINAGETLTITNINTGELLLCNHDFTATSNMYWDSTVYGLNRIYLHQYESATFIRTSIGFVLVSTTTVHQ